MATLKRKKAGKVYPDRRPWKCELCGDGNDKNPKRKKADHHLCYDPELTETLCLRCHLRLHGLGRCFNHPFEVEYGQAYGPLMFAKAVVKMYKRAEPWLAQGNGRCRPKSKQAIKKKEDEL